MCFAVNGEMQLSPYTTAFFAVFFDFPFAFTKDLQPGGINHQMRDFTPGERLKLTLGTPAAAFLHAPGWPESQNTSPSGRTSPGCAVSDAPRFPAASASLWPARPYCGRGSESSASRHRHSAPAGNPLSAAFSGNDPVFYGVFAARRLFDMYTCQ